MSRPRDPNIETVRQHCNQCDAETDHRKHKKGLRNGVQQYRVRCMDCWAHQSLATYHARH
jgi:hypothetical protein